MDKSKMMMAIIIALLVLLLGTVVGVGVYLVGISGDTPDFNRPQDAVVDGDMRPGDMVMVSLGSLTANLALGPNNRSDNLVLEVEVGLNASEAVDEEVLDEFYAMFNRTGIPIARAEVLDILLTRTYDEVRTSEGKSETSRIIMERLRDEFGPGSDLIVSVRFPSWNAVRGR